MDIRVVSREERVLSTEEIEAEVEQAKKIRAEHARGFTRFSYWVMDRAYARSLRKGHSVAQAKDDAIAAHGFLLGAISGIGLTLIAVGTVGWAWNLYLTARGVNLAIALIFWALCVALGIRYTRRKMAEPFKRLWTFIRSKTKKKETPDE